MKAPAFLANGNDPLGRLSGLRLSRRELLRGMARLAALGGIALVAARLLGRVPGVSPAAGLQSCVSDGRCRGCGVLDGCGLPQALSFRQRAGGQV